MRDRKLNKVKLQRLMPRDKELFNRFLGLLSHELSAYIFLNIYIWKGIFDIYWTLIDESLLCFFKDKMGFFLYLSPLSKNLKPEVVKEGFRIMDCFNKNKAISRIENVEENELSFYQDLGFMCKDKPGDYLYKRMDLAELQGNNFKSKRSSFNYFLKHYQFEYLPFSFEYRFDCLKLYDVWVKTRLLRNQDSVYQGMLEDSRKCLNVMFDHLDLLDVVGRVVRINREIKAFTFGFRLNPDTFCILYEITDLSVKGLSQFIFRHFCSELKDYKFINIMDDSGLENLRRVKLSYHPAKLIPAYIVTRSGSFAK